jgi:hypothetical protein
MPVASLDNLIEVAQPRYQFSREALSRLLRRNAARGPRTG